MREGSSRPPGIAGPPNAELALPRTGDGGGVADAVVLYAALGASAALGVGGVVLRRRGRAAGRR